MLPVTGLLGVFLPFVASSRLSLIAFLLGACMIHHFATGGWRLKQLRRAFVLLFCIVLTMGVLRFTQSRGINFSEYRGVTSAAQIFAPLLGSSNFLGVGKTAAIIDKVPYSYDHTYGETYFLWLVAPIPRSLWPNKPVVRIGGVLGEAIFGIVGKSGIPPGAIGEAYLNFGWLGIPLILFAIGVILKVFYNRYGRTAYRNMNGAIVYSSVIVFVAYSAVSADFTAMMSNGLQRFIPLILVLYFITRKRKNT